MTRMLAALIFALAAAMSDVLAIGKGNGLTPAEALSLFDVFKPGSALPWIGQRVARANDGPASFELAMARKDARLMIEAAGKSPLQILPAIAAAMDRAIAAGRAQADYVAFTLP